MLSLVFALLLVTSAESFSCKEPFKNVTVLVYKDSFSNYTLVHVKDHRVDFKDVYRVETEPIYNITKLCKGSIGDFPKLGALSMVYSGLAEIEKGAFVNVPSLRYLHLGYNKLEVLTAGIFNKLPVAELYLQANKIYSIEATTFDNMENLEVLDLSFNYIQLIDVGWFKNSPKVTRLSLMYNLLRQIPERAFPNLAGLQQKLSLFFLNNTIYNLHRDAFKGIKAFETLSLASNKLRYFDDAVFADVKQIDFLHLENNEVFCLPEKMLNNTKANEVHLQGNPLICNCLVKIEAWSTRSNTKVYNSKKLLDKCGVKSRYQETTTKEPERIPVDL